MSKLSVFTALLLVVALLFGCCAMAQADQIGFPSFWRYDATLVRMIQSRLVELGSNIAIDGDFGPATAQAVKFFQYQNGLPITGAVNDDVASAMGIQNWPYGNGYNLYYMADLQAIYNKSPYEDLIYIALGGDGYNANIPETGSRFCLFRDGVLIAETLCMTGNEAYGTFTPVGSFAIKSKARYIEDGNTVFYFQTKFKKDCWIQSLLYTKSSTPTLIEGQTLGLHQTEGNIRIPYELAEWLEQNESKGVTVVIDDRSFQPSSIGYQNLLNDSDYADWD